MKPQPRKRLRSRMVIEKDVDLPTDRGIRLVGMTIIRLCHQPPNIAQEKIFAQAIMVITTSVEIAPFERRDYSNNNNDRYND